MDNIHNTQQEHITHEIDTQEAEQNRTEQNKTEHEIYKEFYQGVIWKKQAEQNAGDRQRRRRTKTNGI